MVAFGSHRLGQPSRLIAGVPPLQQPARSRQQRSGPGAAAPPPPDRRRRRSRRLLPCPQVLPAFPEGASGSLPEVLYRLLDPAAAVELPPPGTVHLRGKAGWLRRAEPPMASTPAPPLRMQAAAQMGCFPSAPPADNDNRELDKLVAALGRNKATWRRALQLHEWLLQVRRGGRLASALHVPASKPAG